MLNLNIFESRKGAGGLPLATNSIGRAFSSPTGWFYFLY